MMTKGDNPMADAPRLQRLIGSLKRSAGTIVFGMEDGTVSIFGLVFGVAATTSSSKVVLIAGASGAAAAAVSMMSHVRKPPICDDGAASVAIKSAVDTVRAQDPSKPLWGLGIKVDKLAYGRRRPASASPNLKPGQEHGAEPKPVT
jgi:VIT family